MPNKGSALVKFIYVFNNQSGIPYLSIVHIMASGNFITTVHRELCKHIQLTFGTDNFKVRIFVSLFIDLDVRYIKVTLM